MIPGPDPLPTCATCPWLAQDWYHGARTGEMRCGFATPAQSPGAQSGIRHPRIAVPKHNGCSFHPRALAWAMAMQPGLEPLPEAPAEAQPRRRAIRIE